MQVDVIGEVHDRGSVLGEELAHHGAVGLAIDVGHSVLQHLMKLRLFHLRWGQQFALQQLLGSGPQGRVVVQQPLDHFPLIDTKRRHEQQFYILTEEKSLHQHPHLCTLLMRAKVIRKDNGLLQNDKMR